MARLNFSLPTEGEIALTAATPKTILQLRAPTNQRVAIKGFCISFDGTSGTAEPVLAEVCRYTTNGGMASAALVKDVNVGSETIQSTGVKAATSEPSAGSVLRYYEVHPQRGYERSFGRDEEIIIEGGGKIGIRLTAPANVNVSGHITAEE